MDQRWSKTQKRQLEEGLQAARWRRSARTSESRWCGIAHRRGGREARLARGGIRENDALLGHEMRGPTVMERGGVSMAGGREGQSARKGKGVKRLRQIGSEMVSDSKATT